MINKYRRLVAFVIDMFIVSALAIFISGNYTYNPYLYDMDEAYKEYESIQPTIEDVSSMSNFESFIANASSKLYNLHKSQVYIYGWYLLFYFLYFIVFAYFTEGQTLGKKFTKLKIVKDDDSRVGIKELLLRNITNGSSFFLGATISITLNVIGVFIFNGESFYFIYCFIAGLVGYALEIANVAMFTFGKDNKCLNDKISRSKVIVLN